MTNEKYKKLIEKIISLCPDIECRNTSVLIPEPFSGIINYRNKDITLCDVLRAVKDKHIYIDNNGIITNECNKNSVGKWDLVKNLDDQKDEVHEFLYNLIFE